MIHGDLHSKRSWADKHSFSAPIGRAVGTSRVPHTHVTSAAPTVTRHFAPQQKPAETVPNRTTLYLSANGGHKVMLKIV